MLSRIPKEHAIEIYVTWPQAEPATAYMRDLSLNGMQFSSVIRLQPNQIVKIMCSELHALARIAHTNRDIDTPDRWITGAEFLTLRFRQIRGSFVSAEA
jgi:hypothetical protein